jgi:hypothetical protein
LETKVFERLKIEFANLTWTQKVAMRLIHDGIAHERKLAEHMELMGLGKKQAVLDEVVSPLVRHDDLVDFKPTDGTIRLNQARLRDVEEIVTSWDFTITPRVS